MHGFLDGAGAGALVQAGVILGLLLTALAVVLSKTELGQEARRRRREQAAAARARREALSLVTPGATTPGRGPADGLTPAELARLAAFKPRARLMAGEP